jgi:DNA invertase Pin-like site-specific DNA recombinase
MRRNASRQGYNDFLPEIHRVKREISFAHPSRVAMRALRKSLIGALHLNCPQFVAYYRVSSPKMEDPRLSLEGQRLSVRRHVEKAGGKLVAEFSEQRSGLKSAGRQLREALRVCRMRRATIVVACIDRLSRRMALTTALMDSDIKLAVADSPHASRMELQFKAAWAEHEAVRISERVKSALAEAKKRGVKFGHKHTLEHMRRMAKLGKEEWARRTKERDMAVAPIIWQLRLDGMSAQDIAAELNWRNVPSPQARRWHSPCVLRVLQRTAKEFPRHAVAVASRPHHNTRRALKNAERLAPIAWQIRIAGKTFEEVAEELNRQKIRTTRGKKWTDGTVRNLLILGDHIVTPTGDTAKGLIKERKRLMDAVWASKAAPTVWRLLDAGMTFEKAARELQRLKVATAKGGRWHITTVQTVVRLTWRNFFSVSKAAAAARRRVLLADRKKCSSNAMKIIIKCRKKGRTCASIAEELNRNGLRTKQNKTWRGRLVSVALQSTRWAPPLCEAA